MDYDLLNCLSRTLEGEHDAEWWKNIGEIFLPELVSQVLSLNGYIEQSQKEKQLQAKMIEIALDGIVGEFDSIKCPKCQDKENCDSSEEYCRVLKKDCLREQARKRLEGEEQNV